MQNIPYGLPKLFSLYVKYFPLPAESLVLPFSVSLQDIFPKP